MKLIKATMMILLILGLVSCGVKGTNKLEEVQLNKINVSGKVQGGYRSLHLAPYGEPLELTVYRGDYIKFYLDDEGAEKSNYSFEVSELDINTTLTDTSANQPYFKMKTTGSYSFTIGERSGTINVVELQEANYAELNSREVFELINSDDPPYLLDVRTTGEYSRGHLEGSELIPLQELQLRLNELEKHKNHPIVVYCATGNRSTTASKIMLDMGFKNISNVRYGIVGWARDGYPVKQ